MSINTLPDSIKRISFLDHFRGIAILLVFGFHALGVSYGTNTLPWNGWFRDFNAPRSFLALLPLALGWSGVAIFFVISGFCIHYSYLRTANRSFKTFFIRRFFRIYPPYLIAVLFLVLLFPWSWLNLNSAQWAGQLTSHLFLIHNLDLRFFAGINPSFWSIGVEAQLYLLYPLLLLFVQRIGWRGTLCLTGCIEIGLRGMRGIFDLLPIDPYPNLLAHAGPLYFWFSWTMGAKLADDWLQGTVPVSGGWGTLCCSVLAIGSFFIKPFFPFCFLLVSLTTVQAIAFFLSHPDLRWPVPRLVSDHLRLAGLASYSIYLLHQPFLSLVPWIVPRIFPNLPLHSYRRFLFCIFFYVPFLVFFHWFSRLVEQNSNTWGKKIVLRIQAG